MYELRVDRMGQHVPQLKISSSRPFKSPLLMILLYCDGVSIHLLLDTIRQRGRQGAQLVQLVN